MFFMSLLILVHTITASTHFVSALAAVPQFIPQDHTFEMKKADLNQFLNILFYLCGFES